MIFINIQFKRCPILKSGFLYAFCLLIPAAAVAQTVDAGLSSSILGPVSVTPGAEDGGKSSELKTESTPVTNYDEAIDETLYLDFLEPPDPLVAKKAGYVASIDLVQLISSKGDPNQPDRPVTNMMFGIKRPYYKIGKDIRVIGSVDFMMKQRFVGVDNLATVTLRYDLKKGRLDRAFKMEMAVLDISFRVIFPFISP